MRKLKGEMTGILFIYLIVINVIAFVTYGADKRRAIRHKWRIPEYVLILLALTGGGAGALAGMYFFCHKTRKWKFRILVPLSLILWISIAAFFFYAGDYYHAGKLAEEGVDKGRIGYSLYGSIVYSC